MEKLNEIILVKKMNFLQIYYKIKAIIIFASIIMIIHYNVNFGFLNNVIDLIYLPLPFDKRFLVSEFDYYNLCYDNNTNMTVDYYYLSNNNLSLIFDEFLKSFNDYNKNYTNYLENAVNGDTSSLIELGKKIFIPYIILICFAIIILISWIFYCICNLNPKCCCKSKDTVEPKIGCKLFSLIIFFVSVLGTSIICCIGFVYTDKFVQNMNKFECSLLRFYFDTQFGETLENSPKWIGVQNFKPTISKLNNIYNLILEEYKAIFRKINWIDKEKIELNSHLKTLYDKYKDKTVANPNAYSTINNIKPDFIKVKFY